MFFPAKCPHISVICRWGWPAQKPSEDDDEFKSRIEREVYFAAKRLKKGYLDFPADFSVKDKTPGCRLSVLQKVVCCYREEAEICKAAITKAAILDWEVLIRERKTFGEEFEFMLHDMIENPGWIVISDHGLNQFCWQDDVPGMPEPTPEMVTAKIALALRCAKTAGVTLFGVRHQKSDGATVKGMPPVPKSGNTGYLNLEPPKGMGDIQQFVLISAKAKAHYRPWNYREDTARALDEQRDGGRVALFEGLTVRFGEKSKNRGGLMEVRFNSVEHRRNEAILAKEYHLKFKRRGAKHHG